MKFYIINLNIKNKICIELGVVVGQRATEKNQLSSATNCFHARQMKMACSGSLV